MGHGWVTPNPNGSKARCGGPALCPVCQRERVNYKITAVDRDENPIPGAQVEIGPAETD